MASVRVSPFLAQIGGIPKERPHFIGRIVGVFDDSKLIPLGVEFINQMGSDLDLTAINVEPVSKAIFQ